MAAIIAQISLQAANRRRDQTKRIPIEKSNVKLPPFDTHFQPERHNTYTVRCGEGWPLCRCVCCCCMLVCAGVTSILIT